MHLRSEECCVFFCEDEDLAAFTIHLQEINARYLVLVKKILEGYRLDFKSFPVRIILWSIRLGFDNFPPTRFFTVPAYLQEGFAVSYCQELCMEGSRGVLFNT